MRTIYILLLSTVLAIYPLHCAAKFNHLTKAEQIKGIIEQAHLNNGFNGAVAIKVKENLTVLFSIGLQKEDTILTKQSVFSSGSVGKEFTTVALLKLAKEGKLQLNDTIIKYLPDLPLWANNITIKHLLSHTSGLPKINWKANISTNQVLTQVLNLESLAFKPGVQYLYGNINVMLRAKVIEKVANMSFTQYLTKHFLEPLGMLNTLQITDIDSHFNNEHLVVGDFPTAIDGVTIYTTPKDLLIWEQALFDGRALSGISVTNFITQHGLSNKPNHSEYDFGRFTTNNGKIITVKHDGSNPSHHVLKYTNIANGLTFVAMSSDGKKKTLYTIRDEVEKLINSN